MLVSTMTVTTSLHYDQCQKMAIYVRKTLDFLKFGPNFIKWFDTIYNCIESCVTNNGHSSQFFKLGRGIRQGCPLSALLFIIAVEMLSIEIRNNKYIQHLKIGNSIHSLVQLADDTTIFIKNKENLEVVLNILEKMKGASGLKINLEKSNIILLGKQVGNVKSVGGINCMQEPFKILGVWFSRNKGEMDKLNFTPRLEKMQNVLSIWRQRDLTLKGKITIIKSLGISQILYVMNMLFVPKWVIVKSEKILYDFLWNDKPAKIRRKTICAQIDKGGLKMVNIDIMIKSMKLSWLRLICDKVYSPVVNLYFEGYSLSDFVGFSYGLKDIPLIIPRFYKQLLEIWYKFRKEHCKLSKLEESIWINENIKCGSKTIFFKDFYNKNMKIVGDIVQSNRIISFNEAKNKFGLKDGDFLKYLSVVAAIPSEWRMLINSDVVNKRFEENKYVLKNGSNTKDLLKCKTKDFYSIMIDEYCEPPVAVGKWNELYNNIDWEFAFSLAFKTLKDTKIQTLQYKILTNIFPCNSKLYRWKVAASPRCNLCYEIDTIEHYICECDAVKEFWNSFQLWWKGIFDCYIHLSVRDIIFGVQENNHTLKSLNYCILLAKRYIYAHKYKGKKINISIYLLDLKDRLRTDIYIERSKVKSNIMYLDNLLYIYERM